MLASTAVAIWNEVLDDYENAGCEVDKRLYVLTYALYLLAEDDEYYGTPLSLVKSLGGVWE